VSTTIPRFILAAVVVLAGACASSGERSDRQYRSPNTLTYEQISEVRATNAYEVVERLRSQWLRRRGQTQLPGSAGEFEVQVYLDDVRLGGVERLHEIGIAEIEYMRYFPPSEASSRWGFGHGAGAIVVSTRPLER
jgi:hypothetical protein